MNKKINIRPSTSVYATYKNLKYNPWSAIAEFVDNSTQSFYDNKEKLEKTKYWGGLNIEVVYERDEITGDKLIIRDNAYGMNFENFQRAIILDSPPKKKNRSEFGMGLKTAACWFGLKWSVESTELGSKIMYKAIIDVEVLHKYRTELIEVEEKEVNSKNHGTVITIWNLHRGISGRQIGKTKDQLRGIYRSDIRSSIISIYYNSEKLFYEDDKELIEKLPSGVEVSWRKNVDFIVYHAQKEFGVKGWIAIKNKANVSNAGFALLRYGRVIVGGFENHYRPEEIFEKSNSFVYQRLFGELRMDNWPVTQTKDAFDWYDGLEEAFIEQLKIVCADYIKKAKEHRVEKFVDIDLNIRTAVDNFNKTGVIGNVVVIPLQKPDNSQIEPKSEINKVGSDVENEANPQTMPMGKKLLFKSSGTEYIFNLKPQDSDPAKQWLYICQVSDCENEYDIEWNLKHPFFIAYASDKFYYELMVQFIFALSLAEIESKKTAVNGGVEPSAIRYALNEMFKSVMGVGEENA